MGAQYALWHYAMRLIPRHPELGWTPYAFLIYLGFFFMYAGLGRGASAGRWAATLLGAALFLILYFRGFWYPHGGRRMIWIATGMYTGALAMGWPNINARYYVPVAFLITLAMNILSQIVLRRFREVYQ